MPKYFTILHKVAKFRHVWSHCFPLTSDAPSEGVEEKRIPLYSLSLSRQCLQVCTYHGHGALQYKEMSNRIGPTVKHVCAASFILGLSPTQQLTAYAKTASISFYKRAPQKHTIKISAAQSQPKSSLTIEIVAAL